MILYQIATTQFWQTAHQDNFAAHQIMKILCIVLHNLKFLDSNDLGLFSMLDKFTIVKVLDITTVLGGIVFNLSPVWRVRGVSFLYLGRIMIGMNLLQV